MTGQDASYVLVFVVPPTASRTGVHEAAGSPVIRALVRSAAGVRESSGDFTSHHLGVHWHIRASEYERCVTLAWHAVRVLGGARIQRDGHPELARRSHSDAHICRWTFGHFSILFVPLLICGWTLARHFFPRYGCLSTLSTASIDFVARTSSTINPPVECAESGS
jgi:hypothetical protein